MDTLRHLRRLFHYDIWANRETLEALKKTGDPPSRSLKILGHIVAAEELWLVRIKQTGESVVVWPEITMDQLEQHLNELSKTWNQYLNGLDSSKLSQPVSYKNSKGKAWTNNVEDILVHTAMHSNYHRGQIAIDLRTFGLVPAYTDFIHFVRQGFVESA
jgi:uncharacterized damage-inducible protein DinB